jgi:hypothetical protein
MVACRGFSSGHTVSAHSTTKAGFWLRCDARQHSTEAWVFLAYQSSKDLKVPCCGTCDKKKNNPRMNLYGPFFIFLYV